MKVSHIAKQMIAFALAAVLVPLALAPVSAAQSFRGEEDGDSYSPWRAARLTYVSGAVSVYEPYSDGWEEAEVNTPLFKGYEIYADRSDRAEIGLGGLAFLRIGDGADITLDELDPGWTKLGIVSGTATLSIQQQQQVGRYELSTPTAALVPERPGIFRVDVADNGDTWVTISSGSAQISTEYGSFQALEGDIVSMSYDNPEDVDLFGDAARWNRDSWDRWNDERDDYYAGMFRRRQPGIVDALLGREDIYGLAELALYGTWVSLGSGMEGWQPEAARNSDWAPYQDGYWDYSTVTGWTWVSNEPWGWAPYHHGRWNYDDRYGWVWFPTHGDSTTTAVQSSYRYKWHPALVYMWQPQDYSGYAWVPLAPGERFVSFSTPARVTAPARTSTADRTYVPRFLRERRGVVAIGSESLMKREKPMRAANVVALRDLDTSRQPAQAAKPTQPTVPAPTVAVVPKPSRGVASLAPARIKPPETVRRRKLVVDPQAEAAAPKKTDPVTSSISDPQTERTERKAKKVQLRLERKKASQAGLAPANASQGPAPSTQAPAQQAGPTTQPAPGRRGGRKLKLTHESGQQGTEEPSTVNQPGQGPRTRTQPARSVARPNSQPDTTQPPQGDQTQPAPNGQTPQPGQRRGKGQRPTVQPDATQPTEGDQAQPAPNDQSQTGEQQPGQRRGKGQRKKARMAGEQPPPPETPTEKKDETTPPPNPNR